MSCQSLTSNVTTASRPAGGVVLATRPTGAVALTPRMASGEFCRAFDLSPAATSFIVTFLGDGMETFAADPLVAL